jgi:hypothetical protein
MGHLFMFLFRYMEKALNSEGHGGFTTLKPVRALYTKSSSFHLEVVSIHPLDYRNGLQKFFGILVTSKYRSIMTLDLDTIS